jgi:hypothetical protein
MRNRIKYVAAFEAKAGMTLSEPAQDRQLSNIVPAGHTLTEENLQQLVAHQVELLCIVFDDTRTAEEVANEASVMAKRVLDTFQNANLADPLTAALFNQVLTYRSA